MREEDVERVCSLMSEIRQREEEELSKPSEPFEEGECASLEFSGEEERWLDELHKERSVKLCELVQYLASERGHRDIAGLDNETLKGLVEIANESIMNWMETELERPPIKHSAPLPKLLAEHHELGEQILDIRDTALGRYMEADPEEHPSLSEADYMVAEAEVPHYAKTILRLMDRAMKESGRSGMTTGEALTYLAERGDQEAQALLEDIESPENQAFERDFKAAVEWHPDWTKDTEDGGYTCSPGCEIDTPEKLVTAYRRARR